MIDDAVASRRHCDNDAVGRFNLMYCIVLMFLVPIHTSIWCVI